MDHDARETVFKNSGYKVWFCKNFDAVTIDGRNVRIILSREPMKRCDVCTVGQEINYTYCTAEVKRQASLCKQQYPKAPNIVVGNSGLKNSPPVLKDFELAGRKVLNRKIGDGLVRDVGAVKYVKYSRTSRGGLKIVFDEIVFAYFSKLKDKEEQERMNNEADEIRLE